jgi:hypothetical protein
MRISVHIFYTVEKFDQYFLCFKKGLKLVSCDFVNLSHAQHTCKGYTQSFKVYRFSICLNRLINFFNLQVVLKYLKKQI